MIDYEVCKRAGCKFLLDWKKGTVKPACDLILDECCGSLNLYPEGDDEQVPDDCPYLLEHVVGR